MTEREARSFLSEHEGQTLCITYLAGADGSIRFQPEPPVVPVARLTRRRAVAAAGFAAAMAACTPTEHADIKPIEVAVVETAPAEDAPCAAEDDGSSMADVVAQARDKAAALEHAKAEAEAEAIAVEIETSHKPPIADPSAVPMPGGMKVPHVAPPSPPPKITKRPPMRRGGRKIPHPKMK